MKSIALIIITCLCGITFAADSPTDQQIKDQIQRYDAAWLKKDVAAVSETMSPEYVYFSDDGKLRDRKWMLDFLQKDSYKLDRSERSEIEIRRTGDTAVVSSRWIGTGSYDGKPINDDQRCGIVLSQSKGRWLIVSEHCTQIAK
jgi:ketosteroid isomerase-like protein